MQDLPDLVGSIKFCVVPGEKDSLMAAWKAWVQQTGEQDSCAQLSQGPVVTVGCLY